MKKTTLSTVTAAALACGLVLTMTGQATARGEDNDPYQATPTSGGSTIGAQVEIETNSPGGGTPMTSTNVDWSPPSCWYAPWKGNKELEKWTREQEENYGRTGMSHDTQNRWQEDIDAHDGKKGMWWHREPEMPPRDCHLMEEPVLWVNPDDPEPVEGTLIDPEMLAGAAYDETTLPAPPVELRPGSDRNIVNLPTKVQFSQPLERIWTTATYANAEAGVAASATVVAVPTSLRVEAGTDDADPESCEYELSGGADGYHVNSDGSDCNITYLRSSGDGTYPFSAEIVWDVTWNPTDDPDGQPQNDDLPDGLSTYEQDVTVKEIQTVVR